MRDINLRWCGYVERRKIEEIVNKVREIEMEERRESQRKCGWTFLEEMCWNVKLMGERRYGICKWQK